MFCGCAKVRARLADFAWEHLAGKMKDVACALGDPTLPTWGASLAGAAEQLGGRRGGAEKSGRGGGGADKEKEGGGETGEIGRVDGAGAIGRLRGAALGIG